MLPKRKDAGVLKETVWAFGRLSSVLATFLILGLALGACSQSESPEKKKTGKEKAVAKPAEPSKSKLYEASKTNCSMFTKDDAAAILNVPVAEIQATGQELYAGNWQCGYKGGSYEKMVSFNISLSKSVEAAVTDMAQYRDHLGIAKNIKPFKDELKKGAYANITGVGDDALWTAVNGTLTVRKGNVSLQVQLPKEKDMQIKVAKQILSRLK